MKTSAHFFIFFLLPVCLIGKPLETFYGTIEVDEPVIHELIESRAMQRLKKVRQYGISYYTTHNEEYSRYDHSLGVFAILRMKGASLQEQIAGLLHDVSHTVFSHVGDYIFKHHTEKTSFQDRIHEWFLEKYGVSKILKKHNIRVKEVLAESGDFPALEQHLPNLCADRIDYNVQGAYHRGYLTKEEVHALIDDIEFVDGKWISNRPDLMKKIVRFSLFMTQDCWGSPDNYLRSTWLAEVILKGLQLGHISWEEIYFGTDEAVWRKLRCIENPYIQERFEKILFTTNYFSLVPNEKKDLLIKRKFRGVNPLIRVGKAYRRLTALDQEIALEYQEAKELMDAGWPVKLHAPPIPLVLK